MSEPLVERLKGLGLREILLKQLTAADMEAIEGDETETQILLTTIKSRTRDTKANKVDEQDDFGTPKRKLKVVRGGRAVTPSQVMFKTASSGFYKTNVRKSTSMSNENDTETSEKHRTRSR